jgi:hypothetical protein
MDISINARVRCSDGPCGQSLYVILKPTSEEITHLVVSNDSIEEIEYMVPVDHITDGTPNEVRLNCSTDELSEMPVFDKVEYIPTMAAGLNGTPYAMWPYYYPVSSKIPLEKNHIPADELAIRRGARVEAADGPIGSVDEFLIDPGNDVITHLVMREGHLWGQKDVTIPVSQIDHYQGNTVYLKLKKQAIEQLPALPVRRYRAKKE